MLIILSSIYLPLRHICTITTSCYSHVALTCCKSYNGLSKWIYLFGLRLFEMNSTTFWTCQKSTLLHCPRRIKPKRPYCLNLSNWLSKHFSVFKVSLTILFKYFLWYKFIMDISSIYLCLHLSFKENFVFNRMVGRISSLNFVPYMEN